MKTIYTKVNRSLHSFIFFLSLWIFFVLFAGGALAQPTNKINYQAVARDLSGNILVNQNIGLRISILNGTGGPSLYTETFNQNTNNFGLFTIQIGGGAVVSGNYNTINWSAGNQWLKVEMDPAGGNSYVNMGESQLLSVPYSMYAASSGQWSSNGTDISNNNSGDVGIGTTNPTEKLEVKSGSILVNDSIGGRYYQIKRNNFYRWAIRESATTGLEFYQIYNDANSLINTVRVEIADDGKVGIGTTSPLSTFNVSHVTGSLTEGIGLTNSSTSSTWYFYSSSSGNMFIGKTSNLGQFDGVTGVYTSLSDARKKTSVSSVSSVLPAVMNLDVKRYEYKNNNPRHRKSIGLMAQDVAPYFPELVYDFRDDAEEVDYLSLDYSGFGVIAIKAIQEQQKIIEELKAEIEALKSGMQSQKK